MWVSSVINYGLIAWCFSSYSLLRSKSPCKRGFCIHVWKAIQHNPCWLVLFSLIVLRSHILIRILDTFALNHDGYDPSRPLHFGYGNPQNNSAVITQTELAYFAFWIQHWSCLRSSRNRRSSGSWSSWMLSKAFLLLSLMRWIWRQPNKESNHRPFDPWPDLKWSVVQHWLL